MRSNTGPFTLRNSQTVRPLKLWDPSEAAPAGDAPPKAGFSGLGSSEGPAGGSFGTVGRSGRSLLDGGIFRIRTLRGPGLADWRAADAAVAGRNLALLLVFAELTQEVPVAEPAEPPAAFLDRPKRELRKVCRMVIAWCCPIQLNTKRVWQKSQLMKQVSISVPEVEQHGSRAGGGVRIFPKKSGLCLLFCRRRRSGGNNKNFGTS